MFYCFVWIDVFVYIRYRVKGQMLSYMSKGME